MDSQILILIAVKDYYRYKNCILLLVSITFIHSTNDMILLYNSLILKFFWFFTMNKTPCSDYLFIVHISRDKRWIELRIEKSVTLRSPCDAGYLCVRFFCSVHTREEINRDANCSSGNWGAKTGEEVLLFARGWQFRK